MDFTWIVISYRNGFERKWSLLLLKFFYMINLPFSFKTSLGMFCNKNLIKKTPKSTGWYTKQESFLLHDEISLVTFFSAFSNDSSRVEKRLIIQKIYHQHHNSSWCLSVNIFLLSCNFISKSARLFRLISLFFVWIFDFIPNL